jgi:hypothetical protein
MDSGRQIRRMRTNQQGINLKENEGIIITIYNHLVHFTNTNLWNENTRNLSPLSHKISFHTCKYLSQVCNYLLCPASASTSTSMGVWDLRFLMQVLVLVASTQVWGAISNQSCHVPIFLSLSIITLPKWISKLLRRKKNFFYFSQIFKLFFSSY